MITAEFQSDIVNLQVTNLFQWDVNQVLKITGLNLTNLVEVHFCNKKSTSATVVNSTTPTNGEVLVNIPNKLLTEPYNIVAYVYVTEGSTRSTTNTITIPVVTRAKPNDYVDTSGGSIVVPGGGSNIDLSSATATRSDILAGKVAFTSTGKVTGTHVCPSIGASQTKVITPTKAVQTVTADAEHYLSSVTVNPIPSEYVNTSDATATSADIAKGKTAYIGGVKVTGTYEGSDIITSFDATTGTLTITEV